MSTIFFIPAVTNVPMIRVVVPGGVQNQWPYKRLTATAGGLLYNATGDDMIFGVDTTLGIVTINLPIVGISAGQVYVIMDEASMFGTHTCFTQIGGVASGTLNSNGYGTIFYFNGTTYFAFAKNQ